MLTRDDRPRRSSRRAARARGADELLAPRPLATIERAVGWFAGLSLAGTVLLLVEDRVVGAGSTDAVALAALRRAVDRPGALWRGLHETMATFTALGAVPTLVFVLAGAAALLVGLGRGIMAFWLVVAAAGGVGVAALAKHLVDRARPQVVPHWAVATDPSFPSGHSADAAIVYLLLAYVVAGALPPPGRRVVVGFALCLIVLVGASRLYLGVHWPSDVLAGWTLGAGWAAATAPLIVLAGSPARPDD